MARNRTVADCLAGSTDPVIYHYQKWRRLQAQVAEADRENDDVTDRLTELYGANRSAWQDHPEDLRELKVSNHKSDALLSRACDEMDAVLAGPMTSPESALAKIECVVSCFPKAGLEPHETWALAVLCQLQSILSAQLPAFDAIEKEAA